MKVDTQEQLDELYRTTNNITETQRDKAGNVVSFKYIKYYGTSRHGKREIVVSLKKGRKNRGQKVYLPESEFFGQLADNYTELSDIKARDGKIIQYKLDGVKYITDPPSGVSTFDLFDYKKFMRITWQRFWEDDTLLRNGYFGGLTGCSNENVVRASCGASERYDLYDIDINHAYPFNYHYPVPCGKFYSVEEWHALEKQPKPYMKFYHIRLKTIKNKFEEYIPLPPYNEYRDFDFLIGRNAYEMIVTEYRLFLIDMIYGSFAYDKIEVFYCATKIYGAIVNFYDEQMEIIKQMKSAGEYTTDRKIACNALTGMFGQRDERKAIIGLEKRNNDILGEVFIMKYSESERHKANNYLLIPMTINDITAVRLFYMLTDPNIYRVSWNTDGAIIAVPPYIEPDNTTENGGIKSKLIQQPEFYSTSVLYNKPLILDRATGEVFNSKSIEYNGDNFIIEQIERVNTRNGFVQHVVYSPLPVTPFKPTDLRYSEISMKLNANDNYRNAFKNKFFKANSEYESMRLLLPYDKKYNFIRHKPKDNEGYWKYYNFCLKWYKMI